MKMRITAERTGMSQAGKVRAMTQVTKFEISRKKVRSRVLVAVECCYYTKNPLMEAMEGGIRAMLFYIDCFSYQG